MLFDGNLNDILGGTLGDAIEQGKVLEPEDRVEIELDINNRDQEEQTRRQTLVIYPCFFEIYKYGNTFAYNRRSCSNFMSNTSSLSPESRC